MWHLVLMVSGWLSDLKLPESCCFGDVPESFSSAFEAGVEAKGEFPTLGNRHRN